MNNVSINQENKDIIPDAKLFGLPRPLAGALIGLLLFLFVSVLAWNANVLIVEVILLLAGQAVYVVIRDLANIPINTINVAYKVLYYFIVFGVSSIPYASFGSLIFSRKSDTKVMGLILLVIYFLVTAFIGMFAYVIAQD